MVVAVVIAVSGVAAAITMGAWNRERAARADVLAALRTTADPGDIVMSPDAGAYRYQGGWSGIVTPEDPLDVVEEALRLYGVRWLALERAHVTAGLLPVLAGDERPSWLSAPVVVVSAPPVQGSDAPASRSPLPLAALYAVCLSPGDARCAP
jgi:hypothetical protein